VQYLVSSLPGPTPNLSPATMTSKTSQAYGERATDHPNRLSSRLFEIAESKKTNITLSADVTTTEELLDIADSMTASSLV
jgi:hypothetical protein